MMSAATVTSGIRDLRKRAGKSIRAWAALMEMSPSLLQYYETEYKQPYLPMPIAEKLAAACRSCGLDPSEAFRLAGVERAATLSARSGLSDVEAAPWQAPEGDDPIVAAGISAMTEGRANWLAWKLRGRALKNAGFLPGDLVIVDHDRQNAKAGSIVCAQIYEWQGETAKTVFRQYQPPYLIAVTDDPSYLKPELVDGERVAIKGIVVASLRKLDA